MKIVREESLISCGNYAKSKDWKKTRASLHKAIRAVDWPRGSGKFTIFPQSGKKRGEGNGVKPIKDGLIDELEKQGWKSEQFLDILKTKRPGKVDSTLETAHGIVALEWETGNISSSHRALNKMALGLLKGVLAAGILVVPSRAMYKFLTDRVGNIDELDPYLDMWRSIPCTEGSLEIVVVEQDGISTEGPRIPKGTDGRAKR
jgi:hypothetical protein